MRNWKGIRDQLCSKLVMISVRVLTTAKKTNRCGKWIRSDTHNQWTRKKTGLPREVEIEGRGRLSRFSSSEWAIQIIGNCWIGSSYVLIINEKLLFFMKDTEKNCQWQTFKIYAICTHILNNWTKFFRLVLVKGTVHQKLHISSFYQMYSHLSKIISKSDQR